MLLALSAVSVAPAACGSGSSHGAGSSARGADSTIVGSARKPKVGSVIVDANGRTLYRFTAEYFEEPWAFEATSRSCETAAPGRRAHFPTWRYSALAYSSYTLDITITWRVRGADRLASAFYDYDRVADYRCQTRNCSSAIRQRGVASIRFDS